MIVEPKSSRRKAVIPAEEPEKFDPLAGELDPLIKAVIDRIPRKGPWKQEDRMRWLDTFLASVRMVYGQEDFTIKIVEERSASTPLLTQGDKYDLPQLEARRNKFGA